MFNKEDLVKAVQIQHKAYQFLLYLRNEIDSNIISISKMHEDESPAVVVYNWINVYSDYFAPDLLPPQEDLKGFCNYFASYLTTSFSFTEKPIRSDIGKGCYCDLCLRFSKLTHLKSVSPKNHDRELAQEKMIEAIDELALVHKVDLSEESLDKILNDEECIKDAAYLAYAIALFHRIQSAEGGLYILALWRIFAWNKNGSPIQNFEFKSENILLATKRLEAKIISFK